LLNSNSKKSLGKNNDLTKLKNDQDMNLSDLQIENMEKDLIFTLQDNNNNNNNNFNKTPLEDFSDIMNSGRKKTTQKIRPSTAMFSVGSKISVKSDLNNFHNFSRPQSGLLKSVNESKKKKKKKINRGNF